MKKHLGAIAVFFVFYFWLSALVYADTHEWRMPCEENYTGMIMDNDLVNPGCDKKDIELNEKSEGITV